MLGRIKDIGQWAAAIAFSTLIIFGFFIAVAVFVMQFKEWCL